MANNFRNINYGNMLFEGLRNYYALNSNDQISILYKLCAAILSPLQLPFNSYCSFRVTEALIASCMWQIGQLTNVLNYLFDASLKRIFITQSSLFIIADVTFDYTAIHSDSDFGTAPVTSCEELVFGDRTTETLVTINIPSSISKSQVVAVIEQIRTQGIPYQIETF